MCLQSVDPLWNIQSHSINTGGKRKTVQENVKAATELDPWKAKKEQLRHVRTLQQPILLLLACLQHDFD